jgi:hypothetical protein
MSDLLKKLRSYPSATCKDEDIMAAADRIAELEAALKLFTELGDNFSDSEVMERIHQARKTLGEK